jgi:glycosyltransferase involved in cell wall biosynthesis
MTKTSKWLRNMYGSVKSLGRQTGRYRKVWRNFVRYRRDFPAPGRPLRKITRTSVHASQARNICVDGVFLGREYLGSGINRYLLNLLRELETITAGTSHRMQILVESVESVGQDGLIQRAGFELVPCALMHSRRIWHPLMLGETARRLNSDVVFMPSPGAIGFKPVKLAVTIHDLIPLLFADELGAQGWRQMQRQYLSALRKADLIVTDSEYSKTDMVARFGFPAERIVVARLGLDSKMFRPMPANERLHRLLSRYGIYRSYLLHVGYWQPRKNLERLVRAYDLLRHRAPDFSFQLVLCGRRHLSDCLDRLVNELSLDGSVVLTGPVSDDDLTMLYQGASGFAMPSLYEGFGLPPLEAMACGVPVMSSDRSSLPEVVGDAALYFNPESVEEIAAAMERLCGDSALREQLVKRGLERVKQFSWEECARATLAALESL